MLSEQNYSFRKIDEEEVKNISKKDKNIDAKTEQIGVLYSYFSRMWNKL